MDSHIQESQSHLQLNHEIRMFESNMPILPIFETETILFFLKGSYKWVIRI